MKVMVWEGMFKIKVDNTFPSNNMTPPSSNTLLSVERIGGSVVAVIQPIDKYLALYR